MAQLMISEDEAAVRDLVGTQNFIRALQIARSGLVTVAHSEPDFAVGYIGPPGRAFRSSFTIDRDVFGELVDLEAGCACTAQECVHAIGLFLAVTREQGPPIGSQPSWESALAPVARSAAVQPAEQPELALQVELLLPGSSKQASTTPQLILRPVIRGRSGKWVRQGISWQAVNRGGYELRQLPVGPVALLTEWLALAGANSRYYYDKIDIRLESIASRRVWDLLAETVESGIALVQSGPKALPVQLHAESVTARLELSEESGALRLTPHLRLSRAVAADDDALPAFRPHRPGAPGSAQPGCLPLGTPAHGLAWWQGEPRELHLARLEAPLDAATFAVLTREPVEVPAADRDRFLREYFPKLSRRVPVSLAEGLEVPQVQPPALRLIVQRLPGHRVTLSWQWVYRFGESERVEPFDEDWRAADRDLAAEKSIRERLAPLRLPAPAGDGLGRVHPNAILADMQAVGFLTETLPAIEELGFVEVVLRVEGNAPEYREAQAAPVINLTGEGVDGGRDWFDLAVEVTVDEEVVPFNELFLALAHEQPYLILGNGTYFSLDREEFHRLAALIAEARALDDGPGGDTIRLSRFQAGAFEELERIGVVSGQAAQWQQTVQRLRSVTTVVPHDVPAGLQATLRPYQLAGFNWLAALYEYGLGGVLADDMGLGKTVQTLALICHVREQKQSEAPFLVVAPTSVASNWAAEAARFAPDLRVLVISETSTRRGMELAEMVAQAQADIVVSSYTLFRLEYDDYAAIEWAGLVLDEAQMVKNHQAIGYQCARKLPAPFKLAITGTPMENNLMELWSLLSITAPGLFASPTRFTDYYRTPIEKGRNRELLDQLRQRVRPLMLRRTKEQVATDLPAKQEQVLELALNPKHRKVYQTHLQRERQKVLGLLGDLQKNRFEIFRSLTLLRQASLDVGLIDEKKYAGVPSTKLDEMMDLVTEAAGEGHRTLIFSQFTRFLASARERLKASGIEHCYLDGKTRKRAEVIERFKRGDAPVFLISLKAGGFGLNLTEADYCIMLDPWWNPATEAQAVDRVHRIGQTKNVMVFRLVAKETIEEKVMALKAEKSALFSSVMDGGAFESSTLTAEDIRGLLG